MYKGDTAAVTAVAAVRKDNRREERVASALYNAVVTRDEKIIKDKFAETLKHKVIPSAISLKKMIARGDIEEIESLLSLNPIYDVNTGENTLLDVAIVINKLNIVKLLAEKRASPSKFSLWHTLNNEPFDQKLYIIVFNMVREFKIVPDIKTIKSAIIITKLTGDFKFIDDVFGLLQPNDGLKSITNEHVEVFEPAYERPLDQQVLLFITDMIRDKMAILLDEKLLRYFIMSEHQYAIEALFIMNKLLKKRQYYEKLKQEQYTYFGILMKAIEMQKVNSVKLILDHIEQPDEILRYLLGRTSFIKDENTGLFITEINGPYTESYFNYDYITSIIHIILDSYGKLKIIPSSNALYEAINSMGRGYEIIIEKIIKLGTPTDDRPLYIAVRRGYIDVIKLLFTHYTIPIITNVFFFDLLLSTSNEILLFLMASGILNSPEFLFWFNTNEKKIKLRNKDTAIALYKYYLLNTNQGGEEIISFAQTLDNICTIYNNTHESIRFKNVVSDTTGISSDVTGIIKDYAHYFPSSMYWQNKIKATPAAAAAAASKPGGYSYHIWFHHCY